MPARDSHVTWRDQRIIVAAVPYCNLPLNAAPHPPKTGELIRFTFCAVVCSLIVPTVF